MLAIIKTNRNFFIALSFFVVLGAIFLSRIEKGDLVFYFSDHRTTIGDFFFRYVTKMGEIFIYLLATIAFLFYRYRYAFLVPVAGFVTLGLSLLLKNYFQSPRPVLYFKKLGMYDQINLVEGVALLNRLSFPSGHTMSAFALYGLLAFILPQKKSLGFFFFFLATLVAISRVYLTQHFFEDIYAGAILGTLIAMTIYYVQSFLSPSPDRWFNQSLGASKNKLPSENHPRP